MRALMVKFGGCLAGRLEETAEGYRFSYLVEYLQSDGAKPVSLTLPLRSAPYESPHLFAFFEGLVAEGSLRELQCREFQLDLSDAFGLLLASASCDVVGCVTVEEEGE